MNSQSQMSRSERRVRLAGVAAAVLVAELIWIAAELVFDIRLQATAGNGYPEPVDISPLTVAVASLALSLLGWAVLSVLERLTRHARRIWLSLALVALAVSLSMPLSGTGITVGNRIVLVLMHVAVAAVVIPVLYRTSPRQLAPVSQVPSAIAKGEAA